MNNSRVVRDFNYLTSQIQENQIHWLNQLNPNQTGYTEFPCSESIPGLVREVFNTGIIKTGGCTLTVELHETPNSADQQKIINILSYIATNKSFRTNLILVQFKE